jgi:hypothetical protein
MSKMDEKFLSRREFLTVSSALGIAALGSTLLSGCGGSDGSTTTRQPSRDEEILGAAQIAEALATTMYTAIIEQAPFFQRLDAFDQNYFRAAREVEMAHYQLLMSALNNRPTPVTTFYFPRGMFTDARVTLDTLVTLEEAFIAAYIVGVRDLSTPELKVTAARILAVESDHRTVARLVATEIDPADGGPFTTVRGLSGQQEPVDPPNDNAFARTYQLRSIADAVNALRPFINREAAQQAGYDVNRPFEFRPFTPRLPNPRGGVNG